MQLELTGTIHPNRKGFIIRDTTDSKDEYGVSQGWGTDIFIVNYRSTGSGTAVLSVTVDSYDGTQETLSFNVKTLGLLDSISSQSDMTFILVYDGTDWSLIDYSTFDADSYVEIPDGIYTLNYILTYSSTSYEYEESYYVSANAEDIIDSLAINLNVKMLVAETTDLVQLIDILALESLLFVANHSDETSENSTLLSCLKTINNGEYEYYAD